MDFFVELLEQAKDSNPIFQFLSVMVVAAIPFLEGYVAVPVGVAIGYPFLLALIAGIVGNWLSVAAVIAASGNLQRWLQGRRRAKQGGAASSKRTQRASQLFSKYGVPGVALIGPLLVGNHIGAFVCIISGASKRYVLLWQTISIVVWATGAGLLVYWGAGAINR